MTKSKMLSKLLHKYLPQELSISIITVTILFLSTFLLQPYSELLKIIFGKFSDNADKGLLLRMLVSQYFIIIIGLFAIFLLLGKLKKIRYYKFGIFWDNKYRPRCPYCKSVLKDYSSIQTCKKCKQKVFIGSFTCNSAETEATYKLVALKDAKKSIEHSNN